MRVVVERRYEARVTEMFVLEAGEAIEFLERSLGITVDDAYSSADEYLVTMGGDPESVVIEPDGGPVKLTARESR